MSIADIRSRLAARSAARGSRFNASPTRDRSWSPSNISGREHDGMNECQPAHSGRKNAHVRDLRGHPDREGVVKEVRRLRFVNSWEPQGRERDSRCPR